MLAFRHPLQLTKSQKFGKEKKSSWGARRFYCERTDNLGMGEKCLGKIGINVKKGS